MNISNAQQMYHHLKQLNLSTSQSNHLKQDTMFRVMETRSTSSTYSNQCSCLSANLRKALAEVNMQPSSVLPQASSVVSAISAV